MRLKHAFIYFVAIVASGLLGRVIANLILYVALIFGLAFFVVFSVATLDELDEAIWKKEGGFGD